MVNHPVAPVYRLGFRDESYYWTTDAETTGIPINTVKNVGNSFTRVIIFKVNDRTIKIRATLHYIQFLSAIMSN